MLKRIVPVLLAAAMILSLGGCGKRTDSLKDGYYTAQAAEYNNGEGICNALHQQWRGCISGIQCKKCKRLY